MKKAAYFLLVLMLMLSCSDGKDLSRFDSGGARAAAEYFYELLAKGHSQAYVDNMQEASSMDTAKYSQFVDLMEQFLHEEKELRGGILSATATRDTISDSAAVVFMDVLFGDSTCEEVMLPLVYTRGRWWIK
jgi:hypothetical protein